MITDFHDEERGPFIFTYTGRRWYLTDPLVEDVDLADIAHALSLIPRWGGHTQRHYSVAQHSVYVAAGCCPEHNLHGLLHDAAEAYMMDIPRPLKGLLPDYKPMEKVARSVIEEAFGLPPLDCECVDIMDQFMLEMEGEILMGAPKKGPRDHSALPIWTPEYAEEMFIHAYEVYAERKEGLYD